MKAHDVGGILLTDDDGHICGLVAEKDYISSITHGSYAPENVTASQLLNTPMLTGSESTLALEYVCITAACFRPGCALLSPAHLPARLSSSPAHSALATLLERQYRYIPVLSQAAVASTIAAPSSDDSHDHDSSASSTASESSEGDIEVPQASLPVSHVQGVLSIRSLLKAVVSSIDAHDSDATAAAAAAAAAAATDDEQAAQDAEATPAPRHPAFSRTLMDVLDNQTGAGKDALINTGVNDDVTAAEAANEMATHGVTCVPVLEDDGTLVGVFTARDFLWRVVSADVSVKDEQGSDSPADESFDKTLSEPRDAARTLVSEVMTSPARTGKPGWSVMKALALMMRRNVRHLPVIAPDTRALLGIVTMSDLANEIIAAQKPADGDVRVRRLRDFLNLRLLTRKPPAASAPAPAPAPAKEAAPQQPAAAASATSSEQSER